jgi:hypothetical protein
MLLKYPEQKQKYDDIFTQVKGSNGQKAIKQDRLKGKVVRVMWESQLLDLLWIYLPAIIFAMIYGVSSHCLNIIKYSLLFS